MSFAIYIISLVVCLIIGIVGGYFILKNEEVKIKELVLGIVFGTIVTILPIVNTMALVMLLFITIMFIIEDDDEKNWWNKTVGGKTGSTGPK